jgi:outer membrane protein OmpA-like peptidoglycan-associated protein
MRILLIGFIAFVGWSWLSTYIYVCKIKGLCNQQQTSLVEAIKPLDAVIVTPVVEVQTDAEVQAVAPKDLVIYFAFDKSYYVSGSDASEYFDAANVYIKHYPQTVVSIIGHTDAEGTQEYNMALGLRRAQTMKKYFESKGLEPSKIKLESKGENEPANDNSTESGRASNRRTVVTLKK